MCVCLCVCACVCVCARVLACKCLLSFVRCAVCSTKIFHEDQCIWKTCKRTKVLFPSRGIGGGSAFKNALSTYFDQRTTSAQTHVWLNTWSRVMVKEHFKGDTHTLLDVPCPRKMNGSRFLILTATLFWPGAAPSHLTLTHHLNLLTQNIACFAPQKWIHLNCRIGQNRLYTPYTTAYEVVSLPKLPLIHRIYVVLANPTHLRLIDCMTQQIIFLFWNYDGLLCTLWTAQVWVLRTWSLALLTEAWASFCTWVVSLLSFTILSWDATVWMNTQCKK